MPQPLLLAEQMALVSHDRDTGKGPTSLGFGLAPLLYIDLFLKGRIQVESDSRAEIIKAKTTDDALLDNALRDLERVGPKRLRDAVSATSNRGESKHAVQSPLESQIMQRLFERGLVTKNKKKYLGIFPSIRYPCTDIDNYTKILQYLGRGFLDPAHVQPDCAAVLLVFHHRDILRGLSSKVNQLINLDINDSQLKITKTELLKGIDWGTARDREQIRALARLSELIPRGG